MTGLYGHRAIIIGGSVAGLAAAGALSAFFKQIVVLERDHLNGDAKPRTGTPQDRHPHILLMGGLRALGQLFPRFEQDFVAAGAVRVRVPLDAVQERGEVGLFPRRDLDISTLCASRPLLEHILRKQVQALPNVELRQGCRAMEILASDSGVRGVLFDTHDRGVETLDASFVVDASGRGPLMDELLKNLDWERPETTEIGVDLAYATMLIEVPDDQQPDWKTAVTLHDPNVGTSGAACVPLENGQYLLTIGDRAPDVRHTNWESLLGGLRGLPTSTLHDAFHRAQPIGAIRHFLFPASIWRHYETLSRLPRGALPLGDAFCRFNPIYGQGMASAARQAVLLRDALGAARAEADPIPAAQASFVAEAGMFLQTPWLLSANADFAYPQTRGVKPDNFDEAQRGQVALFRAVVADAVVHKTFLEVLHLLQPRDRLHAPDIKKRIEAANRQPAA